MRRSHLDKELQLLPTVLQNMVGILTDGPAVGLTQQERDDGMLVLKTYRKGRAAARLAPVDVAACKLFALWGTALYHYDAGDREKARRRYVACPTLQTRSAAALL